MNLPQVDAKNKINRLSLPIESKNDTTESIIEKNPKKLQQRYGLVRSYTNNLNKSSTPQPDIEPKQIEENCNSVLDDIVERRQGIQNLVYYKDKTSDIMDTINTKQIVTNTIITNIQNNDTQYIDIEEKNNNIIYTRPSQLYFAEKPINVQLIKKPNCNKTSQAMNKICNYLINEKKLNVYIEPNVLKNESELFSKCLPFNYDNPGYLIDFGITLGGDGTVLYYNYMFQNITIIPPVLSFSLGSLGFLTPFSFTKFPTIIETILNAQNVPVYVCPHLRLRCKMIQKTTNINTNSIVDINVSPSNSTPIPFQVVNECVIQRGQIPNIAILQVYVDGYLVTKVRADGLIISTPTGSTGYSMSAGGPMLSPSTSAIIITPICPHNISFRPLVLCDSTVIRIVVDPTMDPGYPLIASFDGRMSLNMYPGDSIQISISNVRLPTIVLTEFNTEWFFSIKSKLYWNVPLFEPS